MHPRNFQKGLDALLSVLNGPPDYAKVLQLQTNVEKLTVAHGIIQARPGDFFVPGTRRLLHPHSTVLGFLVGKQPLPDYGQAIIETSRIFEWHKPAPPMGGQPQRRAELTTPQEVLDLLLNHPRAIAATSALYEEASNRQRKYRAVRNNAEQLQERAAEIAEQIREEGGLSLQNAVYAQLARLVR